MALFSYDASFYTPLLLATMPGDIEDLSCGVHNACLEYLELRPNVVKLQGIFGGHFL